MQVGECHGVPRGVSWTWVSGQSRGERLPSCHIPHDSGLFLWARGGSGVKAPPLATRPWKSTALPHFSQILRYIQSTTDVAKLQTSLNLSLARTLHVYGDHTALLADTGAPLRTLIQYTHLAQLHFCLTKTRPDTLPATLFKTFNKSLALSNLHPFTLDYHIQNSLHQLHINPFEDNLIQMVTLPHKSSERDYRNILRTTVSTLWRMDLINQAPLHLPTIIVGRHPTFTLPVTASSAVIFSNLHNTEKARENGSGNRILSRVRSAAKRECEP